MGRAIRIAVVLLLAGATGCVPTRVWDVPVTTGRVVRAGKPVPAAKVVWVNLRAGVPEAAASAAVTNDQGVFAFPGKSHWGAGSLLPADALVRWRLELEVDGQRSVLWQQRLVVPGRWTTPGRLKIECDVAEADPCMLLETDQPRLEPTNRRLRVREE